MVVDGETVFSVSAESVISVILLAMVKNNKAALASFPILATLPKCVTVMTMIYLQLPSHVFVYFIAVFEAGALF